MLDRSSFLLLFVSATVLLTSVRADELDDVIKERQEDGASLRGLAFTPSGGWSLFSDKNEFFNRNIPEEAHREIGRVAKDGKEFTCLAFAPNGGWSLICGKNGHFNRNIPPEAHTKMGEYAQKGYRILCVAFAPNGGWSIIFEGGFFNRNIPDAAHLAMVEMRKKKNDPQWVAFSPNGGFSIIGKSGFLNRNIPDPAHKAMLKNRKSGLKRIAFDSDGGWCLLYDKNSIKRAKGKPITPALLAANIKGLMAKHRVPGASVAIVQNGEIVWARGFGVTRASGGKNVSPTTLFQAASISKPVAAMAALRLVDNKQLSLDGPVNTQLRGWKVPENRKTSGNPVTLRRLLSHTAGLTVHGFGGYQSGSAKPSIVQVLNGQAPANSPRVVVDISPGQRFRYSGGGYCVAQLMVQEATRSPFDRGMHSLVLAPLKMGHSSYQQPLPHSAHAQAASGHLPDRTVVPGNWHVYPEQAAAGLWTTSSDLARFLVGVQDAFAGKENAILSPDLARQMLTRQPGGAFGLGLGLTDHTFSHGGANEGFRCELVGGIKNGNGVVVMTNSDNGSAVTEEAVRLASRAFKLGL